MIVSPRKKKKKIQVNLIWTLCEWRVLKDLELSYFSNHSTFLNTHLILSNLKITNTESQLGYRGFVSISFKNNALHFSHGIYNRWFSCTSRNRNVCYLLIEKCNVILRFKGTSAWSEPRPTASLYFFVKVKCIFVIKAKTKIDMSFSKLYMPSPDSFNKGYFVWFTRSQWYDYYIKSDNNNINIAYII